MLKTLIAVVLTLTPVYDLDQHCDTKGMCAIERSQLERIAVNYAAMVQILNAELERHRHELCVPTQHEI